MSRILEVCVDTADGLLSAIEGGADRIELCSALELGGLTPTIGLMQLASHAPIPVYAMIRPRAGSFVFSPGEVGQMLRDIEAARHAGLAGVVLGASLDSGALDRPTLTRLIEHSETFGHTLHRAFDLVPDIGEAVETAVALGFERILTSGGASAAPAGIAGLQATIAAAADRITIMPGAGISPDNVGAIIAATGAREIHASCTVPVSAGRGRIVELGFSPPTRRITSADRVAQLKAAIA